MNVFLFYSSEFIIKITVYIQNQTQFRLTIQKFQNLFQEKMDVNKQLRFLVLGKSGHGKSSLCKFLTGDERIQISGEPDSCTHQCKLFSSTFKLNSIRGYEIEAIDTPGLDSNHEDIYIMLTQLAEIFQEKKQINGIIYVMSIVQDRDESIKWFKNFLDLFFTEDQLKSCFIPILTKLDYLASVSQDQLNKKKQSRKRCLQKIFNHNIDKLWENYIQWINESQIQNPSQRIKQIQDDQLRKLIKKTQNITVDVNKNLSSLYQQIVERTFKKLSTQNSRYTTIEQKIKSMEVKLYLNQITIKQKFSNIFKFILSRVILNRKPKRKPYQPQLVQQEENFHQSIDQLMVYIFWKYFSKRLVQVNQEQGLTGKYLKIDINKNVDQNIVVTSLSLEKIKQQKNEKVKAIHFPMKKDIYVQVGGLYRIFNIKILRPSDEMFKETLRQIIRNQR